MKKLIGGMFVGALLLAGCGGGEPAKPVTPPATPAKTVCEKCKKDPCVCTPAPAPEGTKKP